AVAQVGSHDPGQRLAASARWSVGDEPGTVHGRVIHRDVDDASASGCQHPRGDLARHQEVAGQVGFHYRAEAIDADFPEGLRLGHEVRVDRAHADPSVVDQHVDTTEP